MARKRKQLNNFKITTFFGTSTAASESLQLPPPGSTAAPSKLSASKPLTLVSPSIVPSDDSDDEPLLKKRARKTSYTLSSLKAPPDALTLPASSTVPQHMAIFHNLYTLCQSDDKRGFDGMTAKYSEARLLGIANAIFRQPVKDILRDEDYADRDRLLRIGGDTKSMLPAWYLDILTDDEAAEWFKLYLGQALRLKVHIDYHNKPTIRKKKQQLRYRLLRAKPSRHSNFVVLAVWIYNDEPVDEHIQDFFEMFGALVFQALPGRTLEKYLPDSVDIRQPERGCMVANPLNQHHDDQAAMKASCQLRLSTDPEIREHYKDACEYLKAVHYVPTMQAMREITTKKGLFRDLTNEFEAVVYIWCNICKDEVTIKRDPLPIYCIESGSYLVRQQSCMGPKCTVPGSKKGDRRQHKSTMFYPIDGRPTKSFS
ncbi:hypothetical protein CBER1_09347 [Cercospora berteroae]|uniref:Uncharacterized protein n=1 Tax=Cercospora berteroae TaxID=357750 RepID=A0A2S6BVC5_9PEZI|nr:hypothetical protein CBER1_09347 [Cercospora berteroae]